jgi:methanogenic corrinoid protein MtbC1
MLARLIEGEIIPRLLMAHQPAKMSRIGPAPGRITQAEVSQFAHLAVVEDLHSLIEHVNAFVVRGVRVEQIYFDLLSPAAKLLGFMWEQDACSFTDVTVALCRLQQIVYEVSENAGEAPATAPHRNALFAMTPGDQHSFGMVLVSEFFRQSGWRTTTAPNASLAELERTVSSERFDLIGFSMSDAQWLERLPGVIVALRQASLHPGVRIMVGGRVFSEQPALFAIVGADATAEDARLAAQMAVKLVDEPTVLA